MRHRPAKTEHPRNMRRHQSNETQRPNGHRRGCRQTSRQRQQRDTRRRKRHAHRTRGIAAQGQNR